MHPERSKSFRGKCVCARVCVCLCRKGGVRVGSRMDVLAVSK